MESRSMETSIQPLEVVVVSLGLGQNKPATCRYLHSNSTQEKPTKQTK